MPNEPGKNTAVKRCEVCFMNFKSYDKTKVI